MLKALTRCQHGLILGPEPQLDPPIDIIVICVLYMLFMNETYEMKMMKIVTTPAQALGNIEKFKSELWKNPDLQARLAYARAWYAHQDQSGRWFFAPSKFVGYQDVDAETYLESAEESDGRRTEAQLQMWFRVVDPETPLYDELSSRLVALLAQYGKAPSTKTRINVVRERRKLLPDITPEIDAHDAVVSLMLAVAKTLPSKQFENLRAQLEDIWA